MNTRMGGGTTLGVLCALFATGTGDQPQARQLLDVAVDTRRGVAVPYIALNRVDIWQIPARDRGRNP